MSVIVYLIASGNVNTAPPVLSIIAMYGKPTSHQALFTEKMPEVPVIIARYDVENAIVQYYEG